jgi:predicted RNA-binding Zn-ribbon protein involved in translation (DUF1610 family)
MSIDYKLETDRAIVRWHCPLCGGETWKQSVRVAVYEDGEFVGAVCPDCLKDNDVRHSVPALPTFGDFIAALDADDGDPLAALRPF